VGTPSTAGENTVHAVYWAPPGYTFPTGYEAGINTFLADVDAISGVTSNIFSVATQYTDSTRPGSPHLRYSVHVGAPVDVTDAYPASGGCSVDSAFSEGYTACVTDAQIQTEISSVLAANSLPTGMGDIYMVVLPPKVESCSSTQNAGGGGDCSDTNYSNGFCAYHASFGAQPATTLYANLPFPTAFYYDCLSTESPNGSVALDSALNMISHEHTEVITDPLGNGWIDSVGNENGDECAWVFGTPLGGAAGSRWNQVINSHHYYLQAEFSNENYAMDAAAGCATSQAVPSASFAVTTPHPVMGSSVGFNGSASSVSNVPNGITDYLWTFGDTLTTGTGVAPSHTYATWGTYTVTLTVTDTDGFTGAATRQVVVAPLVPLSPVFTSASPPLTGKVGTNYQYRFAATGAPAATFSLSGAPAWLHIVSATGVVSGAPPTATTRFSYSVTASNGVVPPATAGPFTVTVTAVSPPVVPPITTHGYWLVGSDGGIFSFGSAGFHGSTGDIVLQRPVVGITPTADRNGYWLVSSDGGIFAFGDAGFYGSLPGLGFSPAGTGGHALAAPIVAMVPSTDDRGYFMVAADGGIFAFGDARFAGSCPGIGGCSGSAVAVVPDASGNGYWLVTATGNTYAFGDAPAFAAHTPRSSAVTSAVRTPSGRGYWVLYADGAVSPYGDAAFYGDPSGSLGGDAATAIFATVGGGYWVATAAGAVDNYGDAPADGSMAGAHLNGPIVAATGW